MSIYTCDFETTVYKGQKLTQVWLGAFCELVSKEIIFFHSIEEFFNILKELASAKIYFHNLKFDGSFILNYLLSNPEKYKHAKYKNYLGNEALKKDRYLLNNEFNYLISDKGLFYSITIKLNNRLCRLYDSAKLIPARVEDIGKAFGSSSLLKGSIDYRKIRWPNCPVTQEEYDYVAQDVRIMANALEIFFSGGHTKMTIGSNAMREFKRSDFFILSDEGMTGKRAQKAYFEKMFPRLDSSYNGIEEWDFIRKSYRGAWVYANKHWRGKVINGLGLVADVNSLYPFVMHSKSGNRYPIGKGTYFEKTIPKIEANEIFFVHLRASFRIKKGFLPTIQIKGNMLYNPREFLETSVPYYNGSPLLYVEKDGEAEKITDVVDLYLTQIDFELFKKHYDTPYMEIVDGFIYKTEIGMFDSYLDKWKAVKEREKGVKRLIAKLFSNNLYGKFATSKNSSYKICYVEEGVLKFKTILEQEKEPGYIPIGSLITSYARRYIIEKAQANYHEDKAGFIYADTDSLHCNIKLEDMEAVEIHPTEYGKFKIERIWDEAVFVRAKTYVEHAIEEDGEKANRYSVTCAGMGEKSKAYLVRILKKKRVSLNIFAKGLHVPENLKAKQIQGGIVLEEKEFKMRG